MKKPIKIHSKKGTIETFFQKKFRDFFLKPALSILKKNQKYPIFWTMPKDAICRAILLDGFYKRNLLNGMVALAVNKNGIALDIGANIRNHSIYFSQHFSKVYPFEPLPSNIWLLKANLYLNKIDNVHLIENGLSNQNAFMSFSTENPHNTNSALNDISHSTSPNLSVVEVKKGDDVLSELNISENIVLIKIDIEGHEPQALEGLSETIKRHQPIIFFKAFNLSDVMKVKRILEGLGYEYFYHLSTNKFNNTFLNKLYNSFDNSTYLKNLEDFLSFDGMNVASPIAITKTNKYEL